MTINYATLVSDGNARRTAYHHGNDDASRVLDALVPGTPVTIGHIASLTDLPHDRVSKALNRLRATRAADHVVDDFTGDTKWLPVTGPFAYRGLVAA